MKIWKTIFGLLILIILSLWLGIVTFPDKSLYLIACDVGQGDAILIMEGSTQVLIDGGPNNKVLDCLSKHMPFWDREIELVISTHPDKDHFGGLLEVVRRYKVDSFLKGQGQSSSSDYQVLEKEVGGSVKQVLEGVNTPYLRLGLIYLDVLNEFSGEAKENTNENSLVLLLRYQNFKAILTGDVEKEDLVKMIENNQINSVNYIKISHHGSKTGTSAEVLDLLQPQIAVISVGKNSYGHPHEEVLSLLSERKIKTFRTDETGDVEIVIERSELD